MVLCFAAKNGIRKVLRTTTLIGDSGHPRSSDLNFPQPESPPVIRTALCLGCRGAKPYYTNSRLVQPSGWDWQNGQAGHIAWP